MTEPANASVPPLGLFARAVGMLFSPKATFQNIVVHPRPFGILFLCAAVVGFATAVPQFTEAGQQAVIDMQLRANPDMPAQSVEGMRRFAPYFGYVTFAMTLIMTPLITLFFTALYWAAFNVLLGGTATFKQVLATVSHSQVILAAGVLAGLPFMLNQPTMSMAGPFNFGAVLPMLEEGSRLAKFMSNLGVFGLWSVFVNAIGLGVLYRRKTAGIFVALLIIYLGFVYLGSAFQG